MHYVGAISSHLIVGAPHRTSCHVAPPCPIAPHSARRRYDLQLKEVTLVFLQSQNEAYGTFEGGVDTEMTYLEFQEALLRISVQHVGGPPRQPAKATGTGSDLYGEVDMWLRDAMLPTLVIVAGELEGHSSEQSHAAHVACRRA
jgi:hypothetical protein